MFKGAYMKLNALLRLLFLMIFVLPLYLIRSAIKSISAKAKDLRGKIVVVTGAGNGLGRELSKQLALLGCTVLCVDIKPDDLEETVQIIRKQQRHEASAFGYVCDIADRLGAEKLRDDIVSKFKKIDMLFNNAGIIYMSKFEDSTPSNIERVVNINILGQIWMTRSFLEHMKETREGHIIFTSSIAAVVSSKEWTIYSTTKSALTGFAMGLRDELNDNFDYKNIFLTVVHPAFINSNNFIKNNISISWPPMKVTEAASLLIDGTRKNYFEFSIPGGELGLRILKLTRCLPWNFCDLLKNSQKPRYTHENDRENLWDRYMTGISQKKLFTSDQKCDIANGKNKM